MFSSLRGHRFLAVPGGLFLSLLLAGEVAAVTWNTPIALATGVDSYQGDLATASGNAVAIYGVSADATGQVNQVWARRSTTAGGSWGSPILLSNNGALPAIAGRGSNFDAVWNNATSGRVRYARSTNGGASFGSSVGLSPVGRFAWRPSIARGPGGVVAVVWEDVSSHAIQVRVSANGGSTFGSTRTLSMLGADSGTAVAIGDGVIYVAYSVGFGLLRIKRSLDNGATWSAPARVTDHAVDNGISLTAAASRAYVAFTGANAEPSFSRARYRSTSDRGANWSSVFDLAPATWSTFEPDLALQGGVLRAVFTRCTVDFDICINNRVFYRQRVIGSSWGAAVRASPTDFFDAEGPHVGYASKILVFYLGDTLPYVRAGTP
jgi:hypothetical protein